MINRGDYTAEEFFELLIRCRVLTEGHDWQLFDMILTPDEELAVVVDRDPKIRHEEAAVFPEDEEHIWRGIDEKTVWLPRLDQVIDYPNKFEGITFDNLYEYYIDYINRQDTPLNHEPRLLIMLRGLQYCDGQCNLVTGVPTADEPSLVCDVNCVGIHPQYEYLDDPDKDHRCMAHTEGL